MILSVGNLTYSVLSAVTALGLLSLAGNYVLSMRGNPSTEEALAAATLTVAGLALLWNVVTRHVDKKEKELDRLRDCQTQQEDRLRKLEIKLEYDHENST